VRPPSSAYTPQSQKALSGDGCEKIKSILIVFDDKGVSVC